MPVSVRATGATASGAANITVNYPTRQNNDILILFVETAGAQTVTTVTAGAGGGTWTKIYGGLGASSTTLNIWWSRWTTGQASSLTVTDTGDHQIGGIMSISGCITTGTPYEGFNSTAYVGGGGFSIIDILGGTTTYYSTLIVGALTSARDANFTAEFSGYTNSNLTNITERFDAGTNAGNGGGFGVFTGSWNEIGNFGDTTVTVANPTDSDTASFAMLGTDSTLPHIGWGIPI